MSTRPRALEIANAAGKLGHDLSVPRRRSQPSLLSADTILVALALFVLAFGVRALLWFHTAEITPFDQVEVVQTAMSFAQHNVLGNPYILPTGPSAHVTPAFPFLLGLVYKVFPDPWTGERAKNILSITISSLQYALLPMLSLLAGLGWRTGIVAAFLGSMLPLLYLECAGDFEAPLVASTIVFMCLVSLALAKRQESSRGVALATGVLWGLTALVSAQVLLVGFVYEVLLKFFPWRRAAARVRTIGIICAGMVIAVLPWTIRNYVELGSPIISRDNAGLELYISNNDLASPSMIVNTKRHLLETRHPHGSKAEARLVQQMGEVKYNGMKKAEAVRWIRTHPQRFVTMTAERFLLFWFMQDGSKAVQVFYAAVGLFAWAGAFLMWRWKAAAAPLFTILLVVYSLPHYIIQTGIRYRYPLNSILLLLGAAVFTHLLTHPAIKRIWATRTAGE